MLSSFLSRWCDGRGKRHSLRRTAHLRVLSLESRITPALNDNFADAYPLAGQFDSHFWGNYEFDPVTFDLIEYTGEVGEPDHAGASAPLQSAWYRWTAPISAPTAVDVLDFTIAETVNVAVYTGSAVNALTEITSVSQFFGATAHFAATAGTEYFIAVDNVGSAMFDFQLILSSAPTPANDDFEDAVVLNGGLVPAAVGHGSSTSSTFEIGEPNHTEGLDYLGFPLQNHDSTWFDWTAPTTGQVRLKVEMDADFGATFISSVTVGLAVYTGTAVDQLTLTANSFGFAGGIAVNDSFLFSGVELTFNSVSNTTYHIAVAGHTLFPESYSLKLINHAVTGSIAIDGTTFVVGTPSSDSVNVMPAGAASDGSTGVKVTSSFAPAKTLIGTMSAIEIYTTGGNNVVTVADSLTLPLVADFGAGNDRYQGGNGPTTIFAGEGNNIVRAGNFYADVYAGDGNDDIRTGNGNDFIRAGAGNNTISTNGGNDSVFLLPNFYVDQPFAGNNVIDTGAGDDYVETFTSGAIQVRGGSGNDFLRISGTGKATIDGADGNDDIGTGDGNCIIAAGPGNDFVRVGNGNNVIDGGAGDDQISVGNFFALGNGQNLIHAGSGNDLVRVSSNGSSVVFGDDGDDEVVLSYKPTFFPGPVGSGAGIVLGGAGNDILLGGSANDLLLGDSGDDLIAGGLGSDSIFGGTGSDLLFDGTVKTTNPDTLRNILNDWNPLILASYIDIRSRLTVTFDTASRDFLLGGTGVDWFWSNDSLDVLDRVPGEVRN